MVYIPANEPGMDKGPTYWEQYTSKEESLPPIIIGDKVTDEEWKKYVDCRPIKQQGKRNDLLKVKEDLDEGKGISEIQEGSLEGFMACAKHQAYFASYISSKRRRTEFNAPEVLVYYGSTGTGKTRKAYEDLGYDENDTYRWTPGCGTTFFDGYLGQPGVIFDELRGQIQLGQLLTLLDGYPMRVQVKGGSVHWSPKKIICTSPMHPRDWYQSADNDKIDQLLRRITKIVEFKKLTPGAGTSA